ncbi:hypothetical protein ADK54_34720 [Streptomyces sp. WM6378]|nr:hypothetical protein ADK54_34720 [Streptomyces sp. WM6378]
MKLAEATHVGWVLAGLQEDGHDDPGDLGGAVLVGPEGTADALDDFDLEAAGVGEADRVHPPLARDVHALPEHAYGGEECPVYTPVVGVDAACELP